MSTPEHLDLCSGIGGWTLAAQEADFATSAFCESDPFCRAILARHWPHLPIFPDLYHLDPLALALKGVARPTLLTASFPCQPYSQAGVRRGRRDDRDLWPEVLRLVRQLRPPWFVGENVAGFLSLGLGRALDDLAAAGYRVETLVLAAQAVGAPHRRSRVFLVACREDMADTDDPGRAQQWRTLPDAPSHAVPGRGHQAVGDADRQPGPAGQRSPDGQVGRAADRSGPSLGHAHDGRRDESHPPVRPVSQPDPSGRPDAGAGSQPGLGGGADGLPGRPYGPDGWPGFPARPGKHPYPWEPDRLRADRTGHTNRLRALGNALVPSQCYPILRAIRAAIDT